MTWAFGGWALPLGWLFDLFRSGHRLWLRPLRPTTRTARALSRGRRAEVGEAFARSGTGLRGREATGRRSQGYISARTYDAQHLGSTLGGKLGPVGTSAGTSGTSSPERRQFSPCRRKRGRRVARWGRPLRREALAPRPEARPPASSTDQHLQHGLPPGRLHAPPRGRPEAHLRRSVHRSAGGGRPAAHERVVKDWSTYNVSAKAGVAYRETDLHPRRLGDGRREHDPGALGSFPGYLADQEDFDRAREGHPRRRGVRLLEGGHPGLGAFVNIAYGWDAIDPDPGFGAGPDGVRPHDRLPAAQRIPSCSRRRGTSGSGCAA